MKQIKCNGYRTPRPQYSDKAVTKLIECIEMARPVFLREANMSNGVNHNAMVYRGTRFDSNDSALARIMSAASEEEAMKNPEKWAWAALEDCAESDYWYTFEKDWG